MLLSHFARIAERTVTGIVFAVTCTIAATYFGQPEIFDPLALLVFITIAVFFRHENNLLSLLGIIVVAKALEEVTWLIFDNTLYIKVPLYIILLALVTIFSSAWLRIYLLMFVGLAIGSEIYWHWTGYEAPWIFWQVWMCVLASVARRAIIFRVPWMMKLTQRYHYDVLNLDDHLYRVYSLLILFYSAITFEYYVRHFFNLRHITFIYYSVEYFSSFILSFVIYMLVVESIKHIKNSELDA